MVKNVHMNEVTSTKTDDHDPWLAVALVVGHEVLALAVETRVARALVNVRLAVGSCCGTQMRDESWLGLRYGRLLTFYKGHNRCMISKLKKV